MKLKRSKKKLINLNGGTLITDVLSIRQHPN